MVNLDSIWFLFIFLIITKFESFNFISEINLVIEGKGNQTIISNQKAYGKYEFTEFPDEVIINGIIQNISSNNIYYLSKEKNYITMKWINKNVISCDAMFNKMKNITSIDLSKFDSSKVIQANYMFAECTSLKYINFSNINTSQITTMNHMFYGCKSLEFLDLIDFNTSSVTNMNYMFQNCQNLKFIDLKSFDTSLVTDMGNMFQSCNSLKSLDLTNFFTPSLTLISNMFYECYSLEYLNIKNLDVSNVGSLSSLFYRCFSLKSLDLTHFDTSKVTDMNNMFANCSSLLYLDLSSFDTSHVTDIKYLFQKCKSLIYLNLKNFELNTISDFTSFLDETNDYLTYCIDPEKIQENIYSVFTSKINMKNDCNNSCFNNNKLIPSIKKCIENCSDDSNYPYEFNNMCYDVCPNYTKKISDNDFICKEDLYCGNYYYNFERTRCINDIPQGFYLNDTKINTIDKCNIKCFECDLESTNNNLCKMCNINKGFYPKEFDEMNYDEYINCYNGSIQGYYLDREEGIYKININENYEFEENNEIYKINEEENRETDENKKEEENLNNILLEEMDEKENNSENFEEKEEEKQSEKENEITEEEEKDKINEIYEYKLSNYVINENENEKISDYISINTIEENTKNPNYIIKSNNITKLELINDNKICNFRQIIEKKCEINITEQEKIISNQEIVNELLNGLLTEIINDINQKNNSEYIIDLVKDIIHISFLNNQSENRIKNLTYINFKNLEEIIKKENNISFDDNLILLKIEHYIEKFNIPLIEYLIFTSDGKTQINLDSHINHKIELDIPVKINEQELFKYNPNDSFYNDICDSYSENKIDITLYDRKGIYNKNNLALCEVNCTYINYDYNNKNVKCECPIKSSANFFLDLVNIDTDKLIHKFINIQNLINFDVIKCRNLIFTTNLFKSNIGNYYSLIIIILSIIEFILFCISGYNILFTQIKTLSNKFKNEKMKIKHFNTNKNFPPKKFKKRNYNSNNKLINFSSNKKINIGKDIKELNPHPIMTNDNNNENNIIKKNKEKIFQINNSIDNYNDYELNSLSYKRALNIDKRTLIEYYLSLLRTKHLIIFTFFTKNDYNSRIIKIELFLFSVILYFFVNAIFFNDKTMHQIYEDNGDFNFIYQIPQMIFSIIISALIKFIIQSLSLTEKNIIKIKHCKNKEKILNKTLKVIKIKFVFFFIFNFLFLAFFWYYLSSFCAVYKNTQIHLFKDTIISFCGTLVYPFIINFFPSFLRYKAIHCKNKNRKCLYQISKILQII